MACHFSLKETFFFFFLIINDVNVIMYFSRCEKKKNKRHEYANEKIDDRTC